MHKVRWYVRFWRKLACCTEQDTVTYPNLRGLCNSLAPEILSWCLFAFGERLVPTALVFRLRRTRTFGAQARISRSFMGLSNSALILAKNKLGLSRRIESLTKTNQKSDMSFLGKICIFSLVFGQNSSSQDAKFLNFRSQDPSFF